MKQNVFEVTINYHGGTRSEVDVIAADDVKARVAAIKQDAKEFKDNLIDQPKIEYCEVRFICEAVKG